MKNEWIWLDMDGTFADLYGVENWLEDLENHNTRPYVEAKPMYNMGELLELLYGLKESGYNIGIISWLSKDRDADYEMRVRDAKIEWIKSHYMDLLLDKILITSYGVCKADSCRQYGRGILVDDEDRNRREWDLGDTINANENIITLLSDLLD